MSERWVFPQACPGCKSEAGYPFEAATLRGSVTTVRIALRCRECRYEWQMKLDTDPRSEDEEPRQE